MDYAEAFVAFRKQHEKRAGWTDLLNQAGDYLGKHEWAQGALGGGIAGGLTGLLPGQSVMRNALIGAGLGGGAGYLHQNWGSLTGKANPQAGSLPASDEEKALTQQYDVTERPPGHDFNETKNEPATQHPQAARMRNIQFARDAQAVAENRLHLMTPDQLAHQPPQLQQLFQRWKTNRPYEEAHPNSTSLVGDAWRGSKNLVADSLHEANAQMGRAEGGLGRAASSIGQPVWEGLKGTGRLLHSGFQGLGYLAGLPIRTPEENEAAWQRVGSDYAPQPDPAAGQAWLQQHPGVR